VTKFLGEHPGGELAILTFAGKDATEEFNMIHPPDVIGKYAPDAVIGALGAGKPKKEKKAKAAKAKDAPALDSSGHNIVEEYVLLSAMLHVAVALKRTWDISINYTIASGKMNLAISGVCLLTFMTIHLFQFRFGETKPYKICPPPYLVNVKGLLHLALFWVGYEGCTSVDVRDIYRLEFEIFKSWGWVMFYVSAVAIFCTHMCLGWQKVVPAPSLDIPKRYHSKAIHVGYVMTAFVGLIYVSFPVYTHLASMTYGYFGAEMPS